MKHLCYTPAVVQEYERRTTSVSLINYHFIWCPKYRRQVLDGPVNERLETLMRETLAKLDCEVPALEVMPDHVHLPSTGSGRRFVNCPPTLAPCRIMFHIKGRSARVQRQEFPHLRRLPTLWTRSYFVATAGNVSADTIRRYPSTGSGHRIEMQKRRA